MADPFDLSDLIERADEALSEYETVTGSELPPSLKAAIATGEEWLEKVNGLEDVINHLAYTHRREDKQRLISLPAAIAVLRDYEDALVGSLVSRWGRLLDSQLYGTVDTVILILSNLGAIWDAAKSAGLIRSLARYAFKAIALPEFAKDVGIAFTLAQRWELTLANKKLRQNRHAKRFRRRAVTRRR